jgi:hypothetical protein
MILRKLARHFLSTKETITYQADGTWSHNRKEFVSFPAYVAAWLKSKFGEHKLLIPFNTLEATLKTMGPGSSATFTPCVTPTPAGLAEAVVLEFHDPAGKQLYSGKVYYDYEDPEWFGISVRMACSVVNGTSARSAFR